LNGFLDVSWLQKAVSSCRAVCRVETPAQFGTGFLIAPNMVITNWHVMREVVEDPSKAGEVVLRFDYARQPDGKLDKNGTAHQLATTDWLLGSSLNTDLDYAVLQTQTRPADDAVGNLQRGFLQPDPKHTFRAGEDLFIVQHPMLGGMETEPLKIVMAPKAVTGLAANGTRVLYQTNTQHGSSGSPCFTSDWDLVALHRANHDAQTNEGVPFKAIVESLRQNPKAAAALSL
jgi:V8-like Glu-specific endopeptidase